MLRRSGIARLGDVQLAMLEPTGELSVPTEDAERGRATLFDPASRRSEPDSLNWPHCDGESGPTQGSPVLV